MPFLNLSNPKLQMLLLAVSSIALPSGLAAAPQISNVVLSGSGDVVIEGTGFGGGPTVAIHDDFSTARIESGSVSLSPQVGQWLIGNSSSQSIVIDQKYQSKSLFVRGSGSSLFVFGIPDSTAPQGLRTFQEVYMSYTIRDFGDFPGTGGTPTSFSTQSATKDAWMMLGDRGDNTQYAVSQGEASGHDLYIPGWTGTGFNIAGNNTRMEPSFWQGRLTENWDFGGWNTNMFHAELNPSNPYGKAEGFFSFINENGYYSNVRNGNFMEDQRDEGVPYASWDRIKFFSWMNEGDANVRRVVDEIYVALGRNANARLLVTDNEKLGNSTRAFHLTPISWSGSEIVAGFPDYLPDDNSYFVHVIDANNVASQGIGLCQRCPIAPEIFPVQ